jgi:type I restriction enzyme S subunit
LIKNAILLHPPKQEQIKIANYLDQKTEQIDKAITQKQELIKLLKERQQIVINSAVTKGIDNSVVIKDSGVEWLGGVPEHWEVKALKYILKERNERSITQQETLFMMSQVHGLVVRADYHTKAVVSQDNTNHKRVYKNDLVFNKLKAHLGVFSKSEIDTVGLVSPDYAVYYSIDKIPNLLYLEYLFKTPTYISHFIINATGIVEGLIRLYTDDLFNLKVPVPPIEEQNAIIKYIQESSTKIDKAINLKKREIERLKELKETLIDGCVTGRVKII